MRASADSHYDVLGVARAASAAEVRRAYRQLALRHHPDRAGVAATALFQRIARAYHVLSNPVARSAYDAQLGAGEAGARRQADAGPAEAWAAGRDQAPGRPGKPSAPAAFDDLIERLAAPLEALIARGAARRRHDGMVELLLTPAEARRGGTAVLGVPLRVPCPTCGGCAQAGSVWCVRCQFAGNVIEDITVCICIPPLVADGATFAVPVDPQGVMPPLRVRLRF